MYISCKIYLEMLKKVFENYMKSFTVIKVIIPQSEKDGISTKQSRFKCCDLYDLSLMNKYSRLGLPCVTLPSVYPYTTSPPLFTRQVCVCVCVCVCIKARTAPHKPTVSNQTP